MKTLLVHKHISLLNGYLTANNQVGNRLFMERDIMYGSSAVYCWFMALILIGKASYKQLVNPALISSKTALGKFVKALDDALQDDLGFEINTHGGALLDQSGMGKHIMFCEPDSCFIDLFMSNHMTLNNALFIEFQVQGFEDTFTMLVTAIEEDTGKTIQGLYCLSPDNSKEPLNYWNAVFEKDGLDTDYAYNWVDYAHGETHRAKLLRTMALMNI